MVTIISPFTHATFVTTSTSEHCDEVLDELEETDEVLLDELLIAELLTDELLGELRLELLLLDLLLLLDPLLWLEVLLWLELLRDELDELLHGGGDPSTGTRTSAQQTAGYDSGC